MARKTTAHYSFVAGEADYQFERRQDWELWVMSARRMRNVRLLRSGWKRRPGMARVAALPSVARLFPFTAKDGSELLVILTDGGYRVMSTEEAMLTTVASGMVWAAADLGTLQIDGENNEITVTSQAFWPQVMERAAGGSWSVADLAFDAGALGEIYQPYFRFPETKGITLAPAALTGSGVAIEASADLFTPGHVGVAFRLYDREIEIVSVVDAQTATCDIKQQLYPTITVSVSDSSYFLVGQQVTTDVDDINGEVVAVPSSTTVRVQLTDGYTYPTTTSNELNGPTGTSAITGVTGYSTPAPVLQWTEALVSTARGYPAGNVYHRQRHCLYGFPQAPHVFCASVQDETRNFDAGTATDSDAIQTYPGNAIGKAMRHCVSAEQLIALTDVGAYYVGEGPGTPFTPTTVDFLDIAPQPAAVANPIVAQEGVIFPHARVARLVVLAPTGNVRRSWQAADLSDLAPHFLDGVQRLLLVDGCEWGPERYVMAIDAAGALSVMHYREGQEATGWTQWTTDGEIIDICHFNNRVYAVVRRGSSYALERYDDDRLLDDSLLATGATSLTNAHWASREVELVWRKAVSGEPRRASLGRFSASSSGVVSGLAAESRDYEIGRSFAVLVEPHPPMDPARPLLTPTRLSRVTVDLVASGHFTVSGEDVTPYDYLDDQEELPPLRTRLAHVHPLGCEFDLTTQIEQDFAAPLEVRTIVVVAS